jgi:hypothetical protein
MVDVCYVYIQNFSFDFFMVFWMMFSDFGVPGVHHVLEYLIRSPRSSITASKKHRGSWMTMINHTQQTKYTQLYKLENRNALLKTDG